MKNAKIKCVKNLPPFVEGNEYQADGRTFTNIEDINDKQVLIIESETEDELLNCYLIPLDKVYDHFILID